MCGITGIINKGNSSIKFEDIKRMNDMIVHRGPDDEGFYFGENFAFGHRRLSILDLSKEGHQPMQYMDDRYVITYNGEVYNYLELKDELINYGYKFNSNTDTEVILASYDKWGKECLNKFNGMWAFAIYDKLQNIIFLSRDRFGVKPLYYYTDDNVFVFGSEIKQILQFASKKINTSILNDYIVTGFLEHTNETFFKNIYKLEGACNLVYDLCAHKFYIKKYYEIKTYDFTKLDEEKSIKLYENELERSVKLRLRSDVKVGTCLSGGLDSSSVAAIGSRYYNGEFRAIHARSIEKNTDESAFAKMVAKDSKLDLSIISPSKKEFQKYIDEVIYAQEEPFGGPSIFMQYFVMQKAKEVGCKVMLDGQGGDETLLGYERYYPAIYFDILKKNGPIGAIRAIKDSNKNNDKMSLKWIFIYVIGIFFYPIRKRKYKRDAFFMEDFNEYNFLKTMAKSFIDILKMQNLEITITNLPSLLRYEDKNSMWHSIETRLPFLDFQTLQTALSLNSNLKIKGGWSKYILRAISEKFLSKEVVWRKNKLGFNAPDTIWLNSIDMRGEIKKSSILKELCDMDKLISNFDKINQKMKWRLYNIAVWERVYGVKN